VTARITRLADAPAYDPPGHRDVDAMRLQGREAGPTERFWVGRSVYHPGGVAETSPAREETVYVVVDGEVTLIVGDESSTLRRGDSVHLPRGVVRSVRNDGDRPAELLVVMATPAPAGGE
jgi:mannose-6-phosphate isomerase-like protein (cupin superfamily)